MGHVSSQGLGEQEGWSGWRSRGRVPLAESGKGARGARGPAPNPTSLPHAWLPHLGGGSVSGAAARVCEQRLEGNWSLARWLQEPEGPQGMAEICGPLHTWAARPTPARAGLRRRR